MRIHEIMSAEDREDFLFMLYGNYGPEQRDLAWEEQKLQVALLHSKIEKEEAAAAKARAEAAKLAQEFLATNC